MPRVPYVTGWSPSSLLRKALSATLIIRKEDLGSKGERSFGLLTSLGWNHKLTKQETSLFKEQQ